MPELPEVETIRRGLEKLIVGAEIIDVEVRLPKMVKGPVQGIRGAKVRSIRRRGKGLLIDLDNGYSLAVHVKMTGQLIYKEARGTKETQGRAVKNLHPVLVAPEELPSKHTHAIFRLRHPELATLRQKIAPLGVSGSQGIPDQALPAGRQVRDDRRGEEAFLFYNDIRQFGWLQVALTAEAENLPFFQSLGPEPLKNLDRETFSLILSRSKTPIKQVLMDQSRLAGVGNIYANDALYRARIHPLRPANSLSEEEIVALFEAVEYVLTEGINAGGASEENFVNALGEKGFYQERFLVYKQTGNPCKRCGTPIERIVVGGRGTFYCPECQI